MGGNQPRVAVVLVVSVLLAVLVMLVVLVVWVGRAGRVGHVGRVGRVQLVGRVGRVGRVVHVVRFGRLGQVGLVVSVMFVVCSMGAGVPDSSPTQVPDSPLAGYRLALSGSRLDRREFPTRPCGFPTQSSRLAPSPIYQSKFALASCWTLASMPWLACVSTFSPVLTLDYGWGMPCFEAVFQVSGGDLTAERILQLVGTLKRPGPGNLISPTTSSLLTTICSKKIYGRALGYQQAQTWSVFNFASEQVEFPACGFKPRILRTESMVLM